MSFSICKKSDRGTITELGAKNGGIDQKVLKASGKSLAEQPSHEFRNFAIDTSVRTIMEGKRNVYTCAIPEEGDLLTGATLVLRPLHQKTMESNDPNASSTTLVEKIEIRLNGQCIQSLRSNELVVPYTGINDSATHLQQRTYQNQTDLASSPFFIPINAFFAKEGNAFPLVDNEYPLEVKVTFKDILNLRDGLKIGDLEVVLMTSQAYLDQSERDMLFGDKADPREMVITQRHHQTVSVSDKDSVARFSVESNLPLKSLDLGGHRLQDHTMVRFMINGHVRFEHFVKFLRTQGGVQGHAPTGLATYHFGLPSEDGVCGRINLSLLDNPIIEVHDLEKIPGDLELTTVNYNVLVWNKGRAYVVLHKSR